MSTEQQNAGQFAPIAATPKLTAVVADVLRQRIITGELKEGDNLPTEPALAEQLGVARPTLREALRILESESLIVPRRGSRAGATIQVPNAATAARYMGFVLQHENVTISDVLQARAIVEPPLAGFLAASKSSKKIEALEKALAEEEEVLADNVAFGAASIRFHETVADLAGVKTMAVYVRQLHWVLGQLMERGQQRTDARKLNARAHRAHQRFVELLKSGTRESVEQYWRSHVETSGLEMDKNGPAETVTKLLRVGETGLTER